MIIAFSGDCDRDSVPYATKQEMHLTVVKRAESSIIPVQTNPPWFRQLLPPAAGTKEALFELGELFVKGFNSAVSSSNVGNAALPVSAGVFCFLVAWVVR